MGAKVSEKLMPCTCENLEATSLALNLVTDPSVLYFILNIYFDPMVFFLTEVHRILTSGGSLGSAILPQWPLAIVIRVRGR